jgi:hypothetical protein
MVRVSATLREHPRRAGDCVCRTSAAQWATSVCGARCSDRCVAADASPCPTCYPLCVAHSPALSATSTPRCVFECGGDIGVCVRKLRAVYQPRLLFCGSGSWSRPLTHRPRRASCAWLQDISPNQRSKWWDERVRQENKALVQLLKSRRQRKEDVIAEVDPERAARRKELAKRLHKTESELAEERVALYKADSELRVRVCHGRRRCLLPSASASSASVLSVLLLFLLSPSPSLYVVPFAASASLFGCLSLRVSVSVCLCLPVCLCLCVPQCDI